MIDIEMEMETTRIARKVAPPALWVSGYEMIPLSHEHRARDIRGILARENHEAKRAARTWLGRLVTHQHTTHVVIVSTGPDFDKEVRQRLEADLRDLGVQFHVTHPAMVTGEIDTGPCG